MGKFLKTLLHCFGLLGIIFLPFPFHFFPYQQHFTQFIFGDLIRFGALHIFGLSQFDPEISSDSGAMFTLLFILFILAIIITALWLFLRNVNFNASSFFAFSRRLFSYYLALQLLQYGLDKVFKSQFYLPEPNLLYTPLGQLDKDILYWSIMGISYSYNVFLGAAEILAAGFILFRKTRVLGLLLAAGLLLQVVAVNFSFDISVKLFSLFLLFLSGLLLQPYLGQLYRFFILRQPASLSPEPHLFTWSKNPGAKALLKVLVVGVILLEAFYPILKSGNFNDDSATRPYLHGAYEVQDILSKDNATGQEPIEIKRFFIHRDGYLIFQDQQDRMQDFKLYIHKPAGLFVLTDYDLNQQKLKYNFSEKDSLLDLQYFYRQKEYLLKAKALPWKKLPALQSRFHWNVDGN